MASKKGSKEVVQLRNPETGVFYITTKNTKSENTQGKMKFRKYDKKLRKHVVMTEAKVSHQSQLYLVFPIVEKNTPIGVFFIVLGTKKHVLHKNFYKTLDFYIKKHTICINFSPNGVKKCKQVTKVRERK